MFRGSAANMFDDVVAKATDENLTSENWEYIMEAVDKVDSGDENAPRDVVAALIKRLAHRNAQVQIYTLETANAISQNCGIKVHRELASRAFTDALLRLAGDRNTHQTVKSKILERMEDWTEMFSKDPGLNIMEQAYSRLKSQNPSLQAPSKPVKNAITDADRIREEEDLARALEISLQDTRRPYQAGGSTSSNTAQKQPEQPKPEQPVANATAATVSRVRALYDFVPTESGELAFRKGDTIAVLESVYKDWWKGSLRGQIGIFPLNYVEKLADPTVEELQKEAQTEAEVFAQIKNVEKLLSMLSTSSADQHVQDNEEITGLYHQTLAIRPKLIDLISKYQQKRDDFQALNEKFVKARRDYESLLDSSMSGGPAAHAYGRPGGPGGPGGYPPYGQPEYPPTGIPGGPVGPAGPVGQAGFYPPQGQPLHHTTPPPHNAGPYGPPDAAQQGGLPYPIATSPLPPAGTNPAAFYAQAGQAGPEGRKPSSPQTNFPPGGGRDRLPSISHQTHPGYSDSVPPQELATSAYESPQDAAGRPISPSHPGAQHQQPYKSYYTYNAPTQSGPPSGPGGSGGLPPLQSWVDPNTTVPQQPGGGIPPGNPADYYRNNELFLPGSRTREA